jgi:hypothetical protein
LEGVFPWTEPTARKEYDNDAAELTKKARILEQYLINCEQMVAGGLREISTGGCPSRTCAECANKLAKQ